MVIYPAFGKAQAQKALDKLYLLFRDIKGSGIRPRFSAQVNDLIWIVQGDSLYKTEQYASFYEAPHRVYYRSDIYGQIC